MRNRTTLFALGFLGLVAMQAAGHEEDSNKRRLVTVQGQGKVHAIPDIAQITAEVRQEGAVLETVAAEVRRQIGKVMDAFKAQGIADKDLQTAVYNVQPKYESDRRGNARPVGFIVVHRVDAKVRDISKVGKILSALVTAGATGIEGPDFDFDNPQVLERKALAAAVEDARAKADVLAKSAGASVGEVWTLNAQNSPSWPGRPRPFMRVARMATMAMPENEPVAAGEQDFTSIVEVTFLLK